MLIKDSIQSVGLRKDSIGLHTHAQTRSESTIEVIKAVGSIWPFLLTVFAITVILIKWKTIWAKLDKTSKLKIGGQELEFNMDSKEKVELEDPKTKLEVAVVGEPKISKTEPPSFLEIGENLVKSDMLTAERLFMELQKQTEDEADRQKNSIRFLFYQYNNGYSNALKDLINLKDKISLNSSKAYYYYILGLCYFRGENYENAINQFNQSLSHEHDRILIKLIWESLYNNGKKLEAYQYLINQISSADNDDAKAQFYLFLSEHFEKEKDNLRRALALEKALEFNPNNVTWLFSAAYCYSEAGLNLLALNHYKKRDFFESDATTSNNLGVAYSKLGLLSKSIEYYKKSFESGETLAASNLAYQYIEKGFF